MKQLFPGFLIAILFIAGCTTLSQSPEQKHTFNRYNKNTIASTPRMRPYTGSMRIMSPGKMNPAAMQAYLQSNNPSLNPRFASFLVKLYMEESALEGVNHDIAFAQMCHETDFLKFGGQVQKGQNNFAGIGATDDGSKGAQFPSERVGVRAQIQHLKAYASLMPLKKGIVDPRFTLVKRGIAPTLSDLSGRWASDREYDIKIGNKLAELASISPKKPSMKKAHR